MPNNEGFTEDCAGCHLLFVICIQTANVKINTYLGNDLPYCNHLDFIDGLFRNFLAGLFPSFLRQNFIPYDMLRGITTQVVKDNILNKKFSLNY